LSVAPSPQRTAEQPDSGLTGSWKDVLRRISNVAGIPGRAIDRSWRLDRPPRVTDGRGEGPSAFAPGALRAHHVAPRPAAASGA